MRSFRTSRRSNETLFLLNIISSYRPDIQPVGTLGAYGIECSKIDDLSADMAITFTTVDGELHSLTVPTVELNVGPFNASDTSASALCQMLINANDQYLIAGASLLKHWYSVWDQGNARMGFAPTGLFGFKILE